MAWFESLKPADIAELNDIACRLGPERFQHYLFVALTIRIKGPIECEPSGIDDPVWDALISERDGCLHLNRGAAP